MLFRKALCLPLDLTGHETCSLLELVFSDIWGHSPMLFIEGYQYFVIFVDAYTKYILFFPLEVKYDVFKFFLQFQVLIERQFATKIKFI